MYLYMYVRIYLLVKDFQLIAQGNLSVNSVYTIACKYLNFYVNVTSPLSQNSTFCVECTPFYRIGIGVHPGKNVVNFNSL